MTEITQSKKCNLLPWIMWSLGACLYFYIFFLQVSPSVMAASILQTFQVDAAALGTMVAFYFYAYAFMQIPGGLLMDHYGPRRILTIAPILCSVGALIFALTTQLHLAEFSRMLMGIGSSVAFIGCVKIISIWFPMTRFAFLTGTTVTIGMLGAASGEAPLAYFVKQVGWRHSLITLGIAGIVIAIMIWSFVRDGQQKVAEQAHQRKQSIFKTLLKGLSYVIKCPQTWLTSIYGALMFAPTLAFGALWGVIYAEHRFQLTSTEAGSVVTMIFLGWAVGGPLFGYLSDKIRRRRSPLYISSAGALLSMIAILYVQNLSISAMGGLLFVFGFFSSGFLPAFSIVRESNPPGLSATAVAFMNTLNTLGGALLQPLIGKLLDYFYKIETPHIHELFSMEHFDIALLSMPICLFLALVLVPFLRETHCEQVQLTH